MGSKHKETLDLVVLLRVTAKYMGFLKYVLKNKSKLHNTKAYMYVTKLKENQ